MKKFLLTVSISIAIVVASLAQTRSLPAINVKTPNGKTVSTANWANDGKPVIISFWATWCKPCITELMNISEVYEQWQKETGVKVIAVSVDDARNAAKVGPLVNGKGWTYEVYIDQNQELKRALNVNNIPHTFLLNGKKEVVYQHNSYTEGSEKHLFELVKKVANGEAISE